MDLKCRKTNCIHNNQYACTAKGILIKNDLVCDMFKKREIMPEKQKQDISKDMFSQVPEIHPYRHSGKSNIKCNAKCLFNNNGDCNANGITVSDTPKSAICITNITP